MTVGHPDFQSYAQWRGGAFIDQIALPCPGSGLAFGPFALSHYAGVSLFASCAGPRLVAQLAFSPDAAGLNVLQTVGFTINGTSKVTVNVPGLAPYVALNILNPGAVGTSVTLWLQPTNIPAQSPQFTTGPLGEPLAFASASVAASGGLSVVTADIYAGPITCFAGTSSGTSHHGLINYLEQSNNTFQNIGAWSGSSDGQRAIKQAAAPAAQIQMSGSNDDTVARTLTYAITRAA